MNKKPIYKRPWLIPTVISFIVLIATLIFVILFQGREELMCPFMSTTITSCHYGINPVRALIQKLEICFIALISIAFLWIIFGIYMKFKKDKRETPQKTANDKKESSMDTYSITSAILSGLCVICNFNTLMLFFKLFSKNRNEMKEGVLLGSIFYLPITLIGIILSIIAIVKLSKIKKNKGLSKNNIILMILNIIWLCLLLAALYILVSF